MILLDIQILCKSGKLYRFDENGELLWERKYRGINVNGGLTWGNFHDIYELPDGRLVIGGRQIEDIFNLDLGVDAWLVITDENGCLEPGCEELIILDVKESIFSEEEIQLIQNPISEQLSLKINLNFLEELDFQIFDANGRFISSGNIHHNQGINFIDVTNFIDGIYFLYVFSEDKRKTLKFIKD